MFLCVADNVFFQGSWQNLTSSLKANSPQSTQKELESSGQKVVKLY